MIEGLCGIVQCDKGIVCGIGLCGKGIVCRIGMRGRKAITGECCHLFPHKAFLVEIFYYSALQLCNVLHSIVNVLLCKKSFALHSKVLHSLVKFLHYVLITCTTLLSQDIIVNLISLGCVALHICILCKIQNMSLFHV